MKPLEIKIEEKRDLEKIYDYDLKTMMSQTESVIIPTSSDNSSPEQKSN